MQELGELEDAEEGDVKKQEEDRPLTLRSIDSISGIYIGFDEKSKNTENEAKEQIKVDEREAVMENMNIELATSEVSLETVVTPNNTSEENTKKKKKCGFSFRRRENKNTSDTNTEKEKKCRGLFCFSLLLKKFGVTDKQ